MASEVLDLIGEPTATTLLNQHYSQLHAKHISLYPQIHEALVPIKKAFLYSRQRPLQKASAGQTAENN